MRKLVIGLLSAGTLVLGGLTLASPAAAAETPTCTADATVNLTGNAQTFTVGGSCDNIYWRLGGIGLTPSDISVTLNGAPVAFQTRTPISSGDNVVATYSGSASGTFRVDFIDANTPPTPEYQQSYAIAVTAGGGSTSSSSSPSPQTLDLTFIPTTETTCATTIKSGTAGTWLTLPGADNCTVPPTKPGSTLLGWATNPNFPVEIAQRQVDNGWGAYETFNADGQLTGVFIPAGGATLLSAAGKLYPIWSE